MCLFTKKIRAVERTYGIMTQIISHIGGFPIEIKTKIYRFFRKNLSILGLHDGFLILNRFADPFYSSNSAFPSSTQKLSRIYCDYNSPRMCNMRIDVRHNFFGKIFFDQGKMNNDSQMSNRRRCNI